MGGLTLHSDFSRRRPILLPAMGSALPLQFVRFASTNTSLVAVGPFVLFFCPGFLSPVPEFFNNFLKNSPTLLLLLLLLHEKAGALSFRLIARRWTEMPRPKREEGVGARRYTAAINSSGRCCCKTRRRQAPNMHLRQAECEVGTRCKYDIIIILSSRKKACLKKCVRTIRVSHTGLGNRSTNEHLIYNDTMYLACGNNALEPLDSKAYFVQSAPFPPSLLVPLRCAVARCRECAAIPDTEYCLTTAHYCPPGQGFSIFRAVVCRMQGSK